MLEAAKSVKKAWTKEFFGVLKTRFISLLKSFTVFENEFLYFLQNCGFVTFDKAGATEQAIAEFNGHTVDGIQLKVSLARRQPVIDPINDASSSATWSTIAASHSQKGSHKDKRDLVAYEEDIF